jgi:hypothetical protein
MGDVGKWWKGDKHSGQWVYPVFVKIQSAGEILDIN